MRKTLGSSCCYELDERLPESRYSGSPADPNRGPGPGFHAPPSLVVQHFCRLTKDHFRGLTLLRTN